MSANKYTALVEPARERVQEIESALAAEVAFVLRRLAEARDSNRVSRKRLLSLDAALTCERRLLAECERLASSDAEQHRAALVEERQTAAFVAARAEARTREVTEKVNHALAMARWFKEQGQPVDEEHLVTLRAGVAHEGLALAARIAAERVIDEQPKKRKAG